MMVGVFKVNAFSESLHGGNPAGVVVDSPTLNDEQMKQISQELCVSETAFVYPSSVADFDIRFFSPMVEVDLCGHATIAAFFTMASEGKLAKGKNTVFTQQTKAGVLPVSVFYTDDMLIDLVMMTQGKPIYKNIYFDISSIADSLRVDINDINDSLPQQMVSTGLFTLPICVKSLEILRTIQPDFGKIADLCRKMHVGSFHVFSFETIDPQSTYHARNFAPLYGINEDPVTGTANGAVSSYLLKNHLIKKNNLICEQGDFIGRPGRVFVEIHDEQVKVGGKAKIVEKRDIQV
jgi:PhzF family phenazine biosynthesis protein